MSEINVETLLKRAAVLEEEKDYDAALNIYNRILEGEPENEIAYERRRAIKNNTVVIRREPIPAQVLGNVRCYISLDGERIGDYFLPTSPASEITESLTLGKHKLVLHKLGFGNNAVPQETISYDFECAENNQKLYLRFTRVNGIGSLHFTNLAEEQGAKNGQVVGGGTSGGCYVATAVYGTYDCPEVWTLRRFRDNTLAKTWYGRAFIRTYYAISPTLVKWFGHTEWFKKMWQGKLDRMVEKLQSEGVESTPYEDKNW